MANSDCHLLRVLARSKAVVVTEKIFKNMHSDADIIAEDILIQQKKNSIPEHVDVMNMKYSRNRFILTPSFSNLLVFSY